MEQIGAGRSGRLDRRVSACRDRRARICTCAATRARAAARRRRCPTPTSSASAGLGLEVHARRPTAGTSIVADLPRRPAARSGSHRGGRRATTASISSPPTFPALDRGGAAARSAHPARSAGAPRADRGRACPRRSRSASSKRRRPRRSPFAATPKRASIAIANPLSAKFDTLRPSLAAGPGRRGRPQPPARPTTTCGCSRSARGSRRQRRSAAVGARLDRRGTPPSTGRAAPRRSTSSTSRASSSSSAPRSASRSPSSRPTRRSSCAGRGGRRRRPATAGRSRARLVGLLARRSPTRAAAAAGRVFVAELDLDRARAATRVDRAIASRRCRAIRSSCAISRSSSPTPCLRQSFVAPFSGRRRRRRSSRCASSIAIREGRAGGR